MNVKLFVISAPTDDVRIWWAYSGVFVTPVIHWIRLVEIAQVSSITKGRGISIILIEFNK